MLGNTCVVHYCTDSVRVNTILRHDILLSLLMLNRQMLLRTNPFFIGVIALGSTHAFSGKVQHVSYSLNECVIKCMQ